MAHIQHLILHLVFNILKLYSAIRLSSRKCV